MAKVKIAILGTGNIANRIAKAMAITPNVKIYAVASRNVENAKAFARIHQISKVYDSYEDVLNDEEVSLVYIATPHVFHYQMAKMCLQAGKNVLCEKPVTVNAKQAAELFDIASKKSLFFSEAMWTRFLPSVRIVQELLNEGRIGKIQCLTATHSFNAMDITRMTDPDLAGGVLLDSGVYLITLVALLFGENISHISTQAVLSDKGVDLRSLTTLKYTDGKIASLFMSMDGENDDRIMVVGSKGYIKIRIPFNWQNISVHSTDDSITYKVDLPAQRAGGYEYMVQAVCDAVLKGKTYCEEASPQKTMFVMKLMDTLREKWGLQYPFEKI